MSEEQKDRRFVAEGLGLLAIFEPANILCCHNIPRDALPFARVALGSFRGFERDELHFWIEYKARHGSPWLCESLPPFSILKCTDLLNKFWGWDRLLVYDLGCELEDPSDMSMYESYLEKFYNSNSHHINGADAMLKCLEKEKALSSEWKAKRGNVFDFDMDLFFLEYAKDLRIIALSRRKFYKKFSGFSRVGLIFDMDLSKDIEECMSNLANDAGSQSRRPFSTYAAACIMKEAELMIEWLSQESPVPDEEYDTSNEIRRCALDLAMLEGNCNAQTAALLLGITKEAEFLLESEESGCLVSTDISMYMRTHASNFLYDKYCELEWAATEINQPTRECVSKEIIDPENIPLISRLVPFTVSDEPS